MKFLKEAIKTTGIEGRNGVFAMPWYTDTSALFYRKDACQKAGVDPVKDFATWDSFKAALEKLNNIEVDGNKLPAMGTPGKNDWNVVANFAPWIYGAGGEFLTADLKKVAFNSQEALEGIKFYSELAVEGLLHMPSLEKNTYDVESKFCDV